MLFDELDNVGYDDYFLEELAEEEERRQRNRYDQHRFNVVLSRENDEYDYEYSNPRGPLYDVYYYNDKGKHVLIGIMQCHCDNEGEFEDMRVIDVNRSNGSLDAIKEQFNLLFGRKMIGWFRITTFD